MSQCKTCVKEKQQKYYLENAEKYKIRSKEHYKNNPEEHKKAVTDNPNRRARQREQNKKHADYVIQYRKDNLDYFKDKNRERKEMVLSLPNEKVDYNLINEIFDNKCALTGLSSEIASDHFVPVSWGHGGTYIGNIIPLHRSINNSKRNHNPFKWIERNDLPYEIDQEKWKTAIKYLANQNGLTTEEFEDYVNWCENNKRNSDQVKSSEYTSIQLWRNEKGSAENV